MCREYNLPVDDELLTASARHAFPLTCQALLEHMPVNEAGGIDYNAFSEHLNYTTTPAVQSTQVFIIHLMRAESASVTSSAADTLGMVRYLEAR